MEKILHSDLKISLDETDRDKLKRLGSGEDPPSNLRIVGGKRQKQRRQRRAALRSLECGGERSLSASARSQPERRTPPKTRHGAPHPR